MKRKDFHTKAFDKHTLTKLQLFEAYAQSWLPTFIMSGAKEIHIFDLFAGPGYDARGNKGSPLRLLDKVMNFSESIRAKKVRIVLHFNEYDQAKYEELTKNVQSYQDKKMPHLSDMV